MNLADLNNLEFDNIGDWPAPVKAMLLVVLAVVILVVGYVLDTSSQLKQLDNAKNAEQTLKQTYVMKQRKASNLDAYRKQMRDIEKTFGSLLRQLPSQTEVPELLVDINRAGMASGLKFERFKPMDETPVEFYAELPIQIRVRGNYHEFGKFISAIANLPRIVTLHDFKIYPSQDKSASNELVMETTARTYRYLDEQEKKQLTKK